MVLNGWEPLGYLIFLLLFYMLPSTGGIELRLATYIFCLGFLAWEGWLLELLNASVEVVFGGLLGKNLGGSSFENRKSPASPVYY
jgi:hypothetical protein